MEELEKKIASATNTNRALRRKEIVEELVNQIKQETTKSLKAEIVRKTNEKLKSVITDDKIEIESIDKYIKLKDRAGASEGQTLGMSDLNDLVEGYPKKYEDNKAQIAGLLVATEAKRLGLAFIAQSLKV